AAARALRVPVQDRRRTALGAGRRAADAFRAGMTGRLKALADWLDARTGLVSATGHTAGHRVPRSTASWWDVFGSAPLVAFVLQVVTGICLATVYAPSANDAWASLLALDYDVPLGWFLRALHGWGSNFMVALVIVHMIQVFLFGAYKYPRELTWSVGVFLLLMTLGMAFTGQIMRFDQDAYWGLGIGAAMVGRVALLRPGLVHLLLGGPILPRAAPSPVLALHRLVLPRVPDRAGGAAPPARAAARHQRLADAGTAGPA